MPKATSSFVWQSTNDATFRTWGQGISNLIQASGLVKTDDTGQINWTTVLRPAANSDAGYEVYRFDDPLQATHPIFVKIFYGNTSNAANVGIKVQVGVATDGAGNFTSATAALTTGTLALGYSTGATAAQVSYSSKGAGYFGLVLGLANTTVSTAYGGYFLIERTRASNGVPNGDGAIVICHQGANNGDAFYSILSFYKGAVVSPSTNHQAFAYNGYGSVDGADILFFPCFFGTPRPSGQPIAALGFRATNFPERIVVPLTVAGVVHEYLLTRINIKTADNYALALIYED